MTIKQSLNKTRVVALLGSGAKYSEIAAKAGCSKRTVIRIAKSIKPDLEKVKGLQTEYQRLLRKQLPIKERVTLYDKIARRAEKNPFAALRSLERIDDLDGVLTPKDKLRQPEPPREPVPMIMIGGDAKIMVGMAPRQIEREKPEAAVIDIGDNGNKTETSKP